MVLFVKKCHFRPIYEGFFKAKSQKTLNVEKLENMMKKECFSEKKKRFHLFKSLLLQKWEGAIYAAGSRLSCYCYYGMFTGGHDTSVGVARQEWKDSPHASRRQKTSRAVEVL